nr:hypothetical protein Iba_chr04fCG10630 [Ipomoea batatas]
MEPKRPEGRRRGNHGTRPRGMKMPNHGRAHLLMTIKIQPPAPSPSSSSQPASSHRQILSSPSAQPHSPPILSLDDSIFSKSAAPYAKDPTPSPSSSLPAAPERFVKVTNWKSKQAF